MANFKNPLLRTIMPTITNVVQTQSRGLGRVVGSDYAPASNDVVRYIGMNRQQFMAMRKEYELTKTVTPGSISGELRTFSLRNQTGSQPEIVDGASSLTGRPNYPSGIYATPDPAIAQDYAKIASQKAKITAEMNNSSPSDCEAVVVSFSYDPKEANLDDFTHIKDQAELEKAFEQARSSGYDGAKIPLRSHVGGGETTAVNTNAGSSQTMYTFSEVSRQRLKKLLELCEVPQRTINFEVAIKDNMNKWQAVADKYKANKDKS